MTAVAPTYFGGHAIADDGNLVCLGSHCSNTVPGSNIRGLRLNDNSGECETGIVMVSMSSKWVKFEGGRAGINRQMECYGGP